MAFYEGIGHEKFKNFLRQLDRMKFMIIILLDLLMWADRQR